MASTWRTFVLVATGLIAVAVVASRFVTRTYATVPSLTVRVVDSVGTPVAGACISESWRQYSFEPSGHREERVTGRDGRMTFPDRFATVTVFRRVFAPITNRLSVHSSYGASAYFIAATPHHVGEAFYKEGSPTSLEIVLRRDVTTCPSEVTPTR